MQEKLRIFFLNLIVNLTILTLVFLGVQNAHKKNAIKFLFYKSIDMPLGFILGISFITGTSTGSTLTNIYRKTRDT